MGKVTDYFEEYNDKKMKLISFEELVDKVDALLNGQRTIVTLIPTLGGLLKKKENNIEDKVEVRSVNFSVEEKLDKIIELLEKLTNKTTVINAPISVKSEKGSSVDINKHLYELANKVQRRTKVVEPGKEEFISRVKEIDWTKIPGAKISLLDEKGKDTGLKCDIKEDGSVVCEPITKETGAVYWGLKKEEDISNLDTQVKLNLLPKVEPVNKKKVYKVRIFGGDKVFVGWLDEGGEVTLKIPKDKVPQLRNDSCADRPWTYKAEWYVEKDNELVEFIPKVFINEITVERKEPQSSPSYYVTGYLTDDGRAVYYDQYL